METKYFQIVLIDGDYAHLRRIDLAEDKDLLLARALLPEDIFEGCLIRYEALTYTVMKPER